MAFKIKDVGCTCTKVPMYITCIKCGYPPSESLFDIPELDKYPCGCKIENCGKKKFAKE